MRLAACLTLESVEIGQSGKAQSLPNEPHRSSAGDAARPLNHHFLGMPTQHLIALSRVDRPSECAAFLMMRICTAPQSRCRNRAPHRPQSGTIRP
jgi:hypothetical protein